MAKKVKAKLKFLIDGGNATPGQKIGPALGQHGVNIGEFVSRFNEQTQDRRGELVPVIMDVFEDRSFKLSYKKSPVSFLIMKELGIKKGSGKPNTEKIGKITQSQIKSIAEKKLEDFNTRNIESAMKIVAGTAKSMGLKVE